MTPPTKLSRSAETTRKLLSSFPATVLSTSDIGACFYAERRKGTFAQHTTLPDFIEHALEQRLLTKITLRSRKYRHSLVRYSLTDPTPCAIAQSLRPTGYLSHETAAYLHGLTSKPPRNQYVNAEQSKKQSPRSVITQESLDRAFSRKQRTSGLSYSWRGITVTILSGKHTGNAGVAHMHVPSSGLLRVTTLERTLIDIAVRPAYAGGINNVLESYRRAREKASVSTLATVLKQLDFAYPYGHAVGFLLQRAGFPSIELEFLRTTMVDVNFYLAHAMNRPHYDHFWKIFVPGSWVNLRAPMSSDAQTGRSTRRTSHGLE